ncbi:GerAB/ArcD/ProY family transporter [Cohnella sp. GCM10012308]|uniref:GerAB/ArcD/ProY family transporter n=1 Tax=Cohnella sp. GCM10012308 TaxID=3317329 RepID=UPI00361C92F3
MKEKLNGFHVALLIYAIELDVTVLRLPRLVAVELGTNGWLGFIGLALLAAFNIWLYRAVFRAGKGRSLFDIAEGALPKFVLYPFYASLALLWLGMGAITGKSFILVFQTLSFQTTSPMLIFAVYCIMVYTLLAKDFYNIVKASTVFFLLSIWLVLLAPYFFKDWSLHRFTSFFFEGTEHGHSLTGVLNVFTVFVGYELCVFLFPYSNTKTKLFKGVFLGHLIVSCNYLLAIFISFGFFSFEEVKILEFPIIHTLEFIEMPFINRVENLVFPFFLFSNIISSVMFAFASLSTVRRMLPKMSQKQLALPLTFAFFLFGFLLSAFREAAIWVQVGYFSETAVAFALPVLLFLLIKLGKPIKEAS